jgi:septal ring factor EnvC (AmiA/AmiB activator)
MTPDTGPDARPAASAVVPLAWRRSGCRLLLALLLLTGAPLPASEDPAATARQLEILQKRIQALQQGLETDRERRDELQQGLRAAEREIGVATRELRQLGARLARSEQRLQALATERDQAAQGLAGMRRQLERDARAAYAMGRQEQVKLVLNQEDPARVGRMLHYYRYFAVARTERIAAVNRQLEAMARLEQDIAGEREGLVRLRDEQQASTTALQSRQQERQQLLARLQEDMRSKGTELEQLGRDEQRLQELVRSLRDLLADIPRAPGDDRPFPARKGNLDWPVQGPLAARFGSRRDVGELTWRGILIRAPLGAEVRAVSHGRVAFADWLRGFGLLVIVDHGNGYMTLYGHNQSLYKEAGEWVETGEVLATVGDSAGPGGAALYFEVRQNGRPVNPVQWIARR